MKFPSSLYYKPCFCVGLNLVKIAFIIYISSVAYANLNSGNIEKTANIRMYGMHVQLDVGTSSLGGKLYFTTYDGQTLWPLNDSGRVSGEAKPRSLGSPIFELDYLNENSTGIYEYGTLSLSMPSADTDKNGVPDWLQKEMKVEEQISGNSWVHYLSPTAYGGDSTISGNITRAAGLSSGNYNLTYNIPGVGTETATGVWYIGFYEGTIKYMDSTLEINAQSLDSSGSEVTVAGTSEYTASHANRLNMGVINLIYGNTTVQMLASSLSRTGNKYTGLVKAVDGNPSTSWPDYVDWFIEVTDPNDQDNDGIPDFSDPSNSAINSGSPQLSNISYSQRVDQNGSRTKLVDIQYDLDGNRSMYVEFFFSHDGGLTFPIICSAVSGDSGAGMQAGSFKNATWDASVDWDQNFTDRGRIMIKATYSDQPTGLPGLEGNDTVQESYHVLELNDTINLEMIWVEPGTFTMGSPQTEVGRQFNESQHDVTLTQGYYLGKYEVTQAQYEAVMAGNNYSLSTTPSNFGNSSNHPVEMVSWDDVQVFLNLLNGRESEKIQEGWFYGLPTEAEWEYACRAGTSTDYSWGNSIDYGNANYDSNSSQTLEVGQYSANNWGFFDMHGNVLEWCTDFFWDYSGGSAIDPTGPSIGSLRVARGGSWDFINIHLRAAARSAATADMRSSALGFRISLKPSQ